MNNKKNTLNNKGQAIVMVVIMIGGILFVATAIAGLLMFYQIKESTGFEESTKAIYGADAALEKAAYVYFNETGYDSNNCYDDPCLVTEPDYEGGLKVSAEILVPPVSSKNPVEITGRGEYRGAIRFLQAVIR